MIKDKLHTISDEDAIEASLLLLKSMQPYIYVFEKITKTKFDPRDGTDAEESVDVYFDAIITDEMYKTVGGWKDKKVFVKLIESDRYHDFPYFTACYKFVDEEKQTWSHEFISNQIEAIEFLQSKGLV